MSLVKNIDKEIAKVRFILSEKKDQLDRIKRKVDMSEKEIIYVGRETELIELISSLILEVKRDYSSLLGKIPPMASDTEEFVLGAILIEKDALSKVISFLKPEHFYHEKNENVYKAILSLHERNEPTDMSSVVNELRRLGTIELIGGALYIVSLTSSVTSAASLEYHARIIVEYAIKRKLITTGSELIYRGYDDRKDCFGMLDFAESEINEIKGWVKK